MKKFFIKFLFLVVTLFVVIGGLNYFYTQTNYWKNGIIGEVIKFKNVPEHIQIANVGSSHGRNAFDYSHVSYQSFNFAISGQRFLYDYAILKQYINRFDKNAVLIVPISYFQITRIKTNFSDQRIKYYHFLNKRYMDFYSIQEKILTLFPVLTTRDPLKFIINENRSVAKLKTMTESELFEYCVNKHKSWTTDNDFEFEMGEEGIAYNKDLVSRMIEFCYANDIQPVLVSTPITSILNNVYNKKSPQFFSEFYRFTRELQEASPSLLYFDYSHDPRFENDFSLFSDGDHLNTAGAEKFIAIIIHDLQESGLLPMP